MSLRFEYPEAFWGFVPLALLLLLMIWQGRRTGTFSWLRAVVCFFGFTALVLGIARPQGGYYATKQRGMRGDLYIAVDISNSMRVEDLSPSRLEFSTAFARRLLRQIPGLRVAIFPFAGNGYLQMPLSTDQDAAADLIGSLTPSITTNQGTDFDVSLGTLYTAILREKQAARLEGAPTRVLLLSDGESHAPTSRAVLDKFRGQGIPIDTVGAATREGGMIPVEGRNGFGKEMLRDESGKPVRSQLDAKTLKAISEGTGGNYYAPRFEEVGQIATRVLQGMEFGKLTTTFKLETEYYPLLFLVALGIFSVEFLFGRWEYMIRAVLLLGLFARPSSALDSELERKVGQNPAQRPYNTYNLGVEMAKQGKLNEASELFNESAVTAPDPTLRKRALFNLGNALVKLQDPTQALAAYQRAYDTTADSKAQESSLNHDISQNILLAKKVQQQQQKEQQAREKGEGDGDSPNEPPPDPGKPKEFKGQNLDEAQKKKMYDLITAEEQQVLQRLQQGKNAKNPFDPKGKPW